MNAKKKKADRKNRVLNVLVFLLPLLFLGGYFIGAGIENEPVEEVVPVVREYQPAPVPGKLQEEITVTSEEDKEIAKQLMTDFLEAFHTVDTEDPLAYVKRSADYMTDELAAQYQDVPRRGTLTEQKLKITHVEYSPTELQEDLQIWTAGITSEVVDAEQRTETVYDQYMILLKQTEDGWKVGEVGIE